MTITIEVTSKEGVKLYTLTVEADTSVSVKPTTYLVREGNFILEGFELITRTRTLEGESK